VVLADRRTPVALGRRSRRGLVRHMAEVENWFHVFDGQSAGQFFCSRDNPDADFEDLDPRQADRDLAVYQACVIRSRAAVIGRGLDDPYPWPRQADVAAVGLPAHDRGVRASQRARRPTPRADRRSHR